MEEISFGHSGKPFLSYTQTTQSSDGTEYLHSEQGYLRAKPDGKFEAVIAHSTGIVEVSHGSVKDIQPDGIALLFKSIFIGATPTAKEVNSIERELQITENTISYILKMSAVQQPLSIHLEAELHKLADKEASQS